MGRIPLRLGPDESQTCTGILVEYLLKPTSHLLCSLERTGGFRLLRLTVDCIQSADRRCGQTCATAGAGSSMSCRQFLVSTKSLAASLSSWVS